MLRAVLKHVPSWNMFQIGMVCRFEKCAFLKDVSDWHRANFVISRADDNMSFLIITFEVALLLLLENEQTNKQTKKCSLAFWSLFTNFYASRPCIYHGTSICKSLHGASLKYVSKMHIFHNGTPGHANLKHVLRMAHVSERHATRTRHTSYIMYILQRIHLTADFPLWFTELWPNRLNT